MLKELKRIDTMISDLQSEDAIRDFDRELRDACRKANDDSQSFKLGWVTGAVHTLVKENIAQKRELERLRELHEQAQT